MSANSVTEAEVPSFCTHEPHFGSYLCTHEPHSGSYLCSRADAAGLLYRGCGQLDGGNGCRGSDDDACELSGSQALGDGSAGLAVEDTELSDGARSCRH